jgi:hypothetical protein
MQFCFSSSYIWVYGRARSEKLQKIRNQGLRNVYKYQLGDHTDLTGIPEEPTEEENLEVRSHFRRLGIE